MSVITLQKEEVFQIVQEVIHQDIKALELVQEKIGEEFYHCTKKILECKGIVWITGVGTSAYVGKRFAHILTCVGVRSIFLSPSEGLHGHSRVFQPTDLLVAISRGGESEEVIAMAQIAHRIGTPVLAFVQELHSRLAKFADLVLPIHSPKEYELGGYLATTSTVIYSAVCDAVCAVVLRGKGESLSSLIDTHPGGAVGKSLRGNLGS